ncbi:protease modulator HflC [Erythrobacter sp. HL-111]|uniref:protease modulator HflC n=1 Tax=Erythrobacter sp. HL-111 TaxID=1798193 RepID=UPI0006DB6377|nr:protease modulator HflC [Erythrobacter sp. HL-111]KPP87375.1 MAG: membrane protease subunit HflC [Erythrobacteraceae bacterium HL-111]SDS97443.1 protease FtsH subunit HflC [Erythrobacter sp. HL-111]
MESIWNKYRWALVAIGIAVVGLFLSAYVVNEEEQVVVVQAGKPVRTVNTPEGGAGPGLYFRIPILESLRRVDRRVLALDMRDEEVLSADQQRLLVNAYARFRVVDPVTMVERANNTDGVRAALDPILNSALRQELGRRTFQAMLTAERGTALANVRANLDREARQYGAEVIDVQIKRTDLPEGAPLQSAFRRMESDREREARTIRAEGTRDARIIRAEADAEAARIYAEAFGRDENFYDFYRAMQSYEQSFARGEGRGDSSFILSPDNEYLRQFRGER